MTSKEQRNGIGQIGINRRTALQMAGVGLAGSALFSGSAAAKGGRWDASVIFVDADFFGPGDESGNITTDGNDNELVLDGAVLYNKKDGADAMGGGPFSLEGPNVDEEGTWSASEVVRFEKYGAFPASHDSMLPQSWKGGLVELEVEFNPSIEGVEDDDTLIVECAVGTNDSDEPEFGSGFFIGEYTEVEAAFNLFTYE